MRDNAFIHPKLGFAFDAPEGFTLDNQSAALIGVGEGGGEALRLDSITIPESTPVTSAIGSGWIDGVKTTSIESKKIDGLEAATAVARGDQWSFRLGAVRLNGRLYRLIFAAHDLSPAVDSRFHGLAQFVPSHQRAGLGAGRAGKDQDRRGGGRRHRRNACRADGLPAAMARSVPDSQRPRAGRCDRSRPTLQDRRPLSGGGPSSASEAVSPGRSSSPPITPASCARSRELLGPYGVETLGAGALGLAEPEETGSTFRDNAVLKAVAAARASGMVALADDSGLCVEALGGAPGDLFGAMGGREQGFRRRDGPRRERT